MYDTDTNCTFKICILICISIIFDKAQTTCICFTIIENMRVVRRLTGDTCKIFVSNRRRVSLRARLDRL